MINYGAAPLSHELEVTLFGPGYGESIAVHFGEGYWMLVDSCLDPFTKKPAAETYLTQLGVSADNVRAIVASHWHDDHVRGLSRLVNIYPKAELQVSAVFSNQEAQVFLATFNGNAAPKLTRGTSEMYAAVASRKEVFHLLQRQSVVELELSALGVTARANALSPVHPALSSFVARMATYIPTQHGGTTIGEAPSELAPNIEAVAIHIDWGTTAVLLGSDLEEHARFGWSALLADDWVSARRPADIYKISHHGSATAHLQQKWTSLLQHHPVACLTPFNLGSVHLPTDDDRARIRLLTPHAYTASGATRKPQIQSDKLKRLNDICTSLSRLNAGFGAVRARKDISATHWRVELFGAAQKL